MSLTTGVPRRDGSSAEMRFVFLLIVLSVASSGSADAQDSTRVLPTLAEIHDSRVLVEDSFFLGRWAPIGPNVIYAVLEESGATSLVRYNLETERSTVVIDGAELVAPDTGEILRIEDFSFSSDGKRILLLTEGGPEAVGGVEGYYYIYDVDSRRLTALSRRAAGPQLYAKFSPDGLRVGFVRKRNLFVVDLATRRERQLTYDGAGDRIINGTFDWVYQQEFGLRDGWSWSPDGSRIAFFKLDETNTGEYLLNDLRSPKPTVTTYRYPMAGNANSEIKLGVIGINTGTIRYVDTGTWRDESGNDEYLAQMGWTPDTGTGSQLWVLRLSREQDRVDLLVADPDTLTARVILSETENEWVSVGPKKITFLSNGRHFVWMSERSGFNHLYLYRIDGTLIAPITGGAWEVTDFHGLDESSGYAYFTATIESPLQRHLYRIGITGESAENVIGPSPERISSGRGTHDVSFSNDLRYYTDAHSSIASPTVVSLHTAAGEELTRLEDNDELKSRLARYDLPAPVFKTIPGAEGDALNAYVITPTDFDSSRAYPVLLYVYGGPGSQTVTDSWGGSRYLWHAYLAETLDIIVASADGRGTGGRGKRFASQTHLNLGDIEAADQVAVARWFAAREYVDADRIGIWGWSYGGYLVLMSMLRSDGHDVFKTGIAVAPVTDWRLYYSIYTERYMSTPELNPGGYESAAATTYAGRLGDHQRLLFVHGDVDDNVHFQQSVVMINELQAANKQFDMMMYPGRGHGIYGDGARLHLFTMMTDYLRDHL